MQRVALVGHLKGAFEGALRGTLKGYMYPLYTPVTGHAIGTVKPKMFNPVLAVEQIQRSLSVGLRIARAVGASTPQSFPSMILYFISILFNCILLRPVPAGSF